ncbi:hypothetical protein GCM10022419_027760 [Nonomuraea rosea]|uniref:Uncharacterized protein n=1 Tax=Nonomuraea rosea TaxID=638574 RepID=A0ABP6W614_9ACTN
MQGLDAEVAGRQGQVEGELQALGGQALHVRAGALAPAQHAEPFEELQAVAQRRAADAQPLGELTLGRQPAALAQLADQVREGVGNGVCADVDPPRPAIGSTTLQEGTTKCAKC